MKLDTTFYRHTLLPNLFKAKTNGINILSKSALLAHFNGSEAEKVWVCCASAQDIEETAEIVSLMSDEQEDVLANLNVSESFEHQLVNKKLLTVVSNLRKLEKNELADRLFKSVQARNSSDVSTLNKMLWKSNLKVLAPEKATDEDVKSLAKEAVKYLKSKTKSDDETIKEAVLDFVDQVYLSDSDFKGEIKPTKIFADLYYKNRDDELDDLEVNSDVSEREVELGMRELKKFI